MKLPGLGDSITEVRFCSCILFSNYSKKFSCDVSIYYNYERREIIFQVDDGFLTLKIFVFVFVYFSCKGDNCGMDSIRRASGEGR